MHFIDKRTILKGEKMEDLSNDEFYEIISQAMHHDLYKELIGADGDNFGDEGDEILDKFMRKHKAALAEMNAEWNELHTSIINKDENFYKLNIGRLKK